MELASLGLTWPAGAGAGVDVGCGAVGVGVGVGIAGGAGTGAVAPVLSGMVSVSPAKIKLGFPLL